MRIQHNIAALNSHRQLNGNNGAVSKNLEKLSSGYRINRAGDDAAGLAISEKMRAQITGLNTASKNAQDGISLVQTAEGALTEVHSMLNRMVELAEQSANGTYKDAVDRENIQKELNSLNSEINRISEGTNFNGIKLLDGSLSNSQGATLNFGATEIKASAGADFTGSIQMVSDKTKDPGITADVSADGTTVKITLGSKTAGSYNADDINKAVRDAAAKHLMENTSTDNDAMKALSSFSMSFTGSLKFAALAPDIDSTAVTVGAVAAADKGLSLQIGDTNDAFNKLSVEVGSMSTASLGLAGLTVGNQIDAGNAIQTIKTAINTVSSTRGDLGAIQNRLDHTINNLGVTAENMTAAESRIRDVDMAQEMMAFTKNNILTQASQAMLAQANQLPQGVLQLLQ